MLTDVLLLPSVLLLSLLLLRLSLLLCLLACTEVPPGHYLAGSGTSATVQKCPNGNLTANEPGTYQPFCLARSDPLAITCVSCGAGILSANNEPLSVYGPDNDGTGSPTSFNVAATSISCCA